MKSRQFLVSDQPEMDVLAVMGVYREYFYNIQDMYYPHWDEASWFVFLSINQGF